MKNDAKVKILFISAAPIDAPHLFLGQELRDIQERLNLPNYEGQFILSHLSAARLTDVRRALLKFSPDIVHFSGHGLNTGELCFENDTGRMERVDPEILATLFKLVSERVNCVLLNACYTRILAEAIGKHISHVIGMNQSIGDEAAILFSTGFYEAIGEGCSIEQAFEFGLFGIQSKKIPEDQVPVLFSKKSNVSNEDQNLQWELTLKVNGSQRDSMFSILKMPMNQITKKSNQKKF